MEAELSGSWKDKALIKFHTWMVEHNWELHSSKEYYHRSADPHQWPPEETTDEAELIERFRQYLIDTVFE